MSYALRPALPVDFGDLAILFQASIEELAADAYSDEQRAHWGGKAEDAKAWGLIDEIVESRGGERSD